MKCVPFLYWIFKVVFSITAQSVLRKTDISKIITAVFLLKFEKYEKCHLISFKAVLPALCVQWLHLFAVKLVKVKVIKYSLLRIPLNFFIRVLTVSVKGNPQNTT